MDHRPSERAGYYHQELYGVEALSRNDVWAVGDRLIGGANQPIIEHWNGRLWRLVDSPRLEAARLLDVAGVSADDVWAVGGGSSSRPIIEHWDGTSWKLVAPPDTDYEASSLRALEALASDDVWAAGYRFGDNLAAPLIEHWDGSSWRVAPTPAEPGEYVIEFLDGISAVYPNDIWAVGWSRRSYSGASQPLALHWDGKRWTRVPVPKPGPQGAELSAVAAISANDVWAVGNTPVPHSPVLLPLIEHWDGKAWSIVEGAEVDGGWLTGVVALSSSDVWAVGTQHETDGAPLTFVQHWDGEAWSEVRSEDPERPGEVGAVLEDIDALPSGELWAVGDWLYDRSLTLVERYGVPFCSDGRDNDRDGSTDHPGDSGCRSPTDGSEFAVAKCDNGYDDDRDGRIDYPRDPGCLSLSDTGEEGRT